MLAKLPVS
uniref:Uncharacterized protein n=1 Tax=Arundo donax TaxID=35708 RepID=A0A0A9ERW0_ARUDO